MSWSAIGASATRIAVYISAFTLLASVFLAVPPAAEAAPPKPTAQSRDSRPLMQLRLDQAEARKWGMDRPHPELRFDASMYGEAGGKRNTLVILIDFSDMQRSIPAANIESLLFSKGTYATGSMRDYYLENSYGLLDVQGQVIGWLRSERLYSYYVDGSRGLSFGNGDRNARGMAEEALRLADPLVDFSQFDNDGPDGIPASGDDDGYVDAVMIVHAGSGSEETLNPNDILSHQSYFEDDILRDGVRAILYTTEPENGRVGVFCHEFGHTIGLPDLYDISPSPGPSVGLGDWSLMSTGVWLNDGRTPAHLDAWSKVTLGFIEPTVASSNVSGAELPPVENEPAVYKIWTNGRPEREYFLAEFRTQTGFDSGLPAPGVLIYHVDESVRLQDDPNHYKVALAQADGLRQLETQFGNYGDTGDPFPGATFNTSFTPFSDPYSLDYNGRDTQVSLTGIDVDFHVGYGSARAAFDLEVETEPSFVIESLAVSDPEGNGDGIVGIGEPGFVELTVRNVGLAATEVEVDHKFLGGGSILLDSYHTSVGTVEADSSFGISMSLTWDEWREPTTKELRFNLKIGDEGLKTWNLGFSVGAGGATGLADDFEDDQFPWNPWTHGPASEGRADAWSLTTARARSGDHSWAFGAGEGYPNLADGALVSSPILLAPLSQLVFYYWVEAESLGSSVAWDGGRVEISNNGGPWVPLEPAEGYPFRVIEFGDTPLALEGVFSGSRDWTRAVVDLSSYSGVARIRFRFVSDETVTAEGLYIDDVAVVSRSYFASLDAINDVQSAVEIVVGVDEVSGPYDGRGFNFYRRREGAGGDLAVGGSSAVVGKIAAAGAVPPGFELLNAEPLIPGGGGTVIYTDSGIERGRAYYYLVEDLGPEGLGAPIYLGPERIYLCIGRATALLGRPFPNPFSAGSGATVTLPVTTPDPECVEREVDVTARIFDAAGRLVLSFAPVKLRPGMDEIYWDGRDEDGNLVPSGVYLWRVEIAGEALGAKTVVIR